ncbi:hypothetical protein KCP74_03450 [Salmonella enterica subsp. enterica]|nr:hypothetical protein KCP74_03450 [Salmonella enterica subsp. enterica]
MRHQNLYMFQYGSVRHRAMHSRMATQWRVTRWFPRRAPPPAEYCSESATPYSRPINMGKQLFPYLCTPHFEPRHKTTSKQI